MAFRKAISPMIAAVLLIAFTVAVGGIISMLSSLAQMQTDITGSSADTLALCGPSVLALREIDYANAGSASLTLDYMYGTQQLTNITLYAIDTNRYSFSTPLSQPTSGLVGWWKFDEGSGNATSDNSGNGNTGNLTNMNITGNATSGWTTGKFGGGLLFDKVNDYIDISDSASLNITSAITITAWIYPFETHYGVILNKGRSGVGSNYYFSFYNGTAGKDKIYWGITGLTTASGYSTGSVPTNQWSHVALTYDGSRVLIYSNGTQIGSTVTSGSMNTYPYHLIIGRYGLTSSFYFNGTIDDVRIYNRALSDAEIKTIYALSPTPGAATLFPGDLTTYSIWNTMLTADAFQSVRLTALCLGNYVVTAECNYGQPCMTKTSQ